jgi:hypothetical protein
MELLAIISLSSVTWILFRLAPRNHEATSPLRYSWICYFLPYLGSAALFGCLNLHLAFLLLAFRGQGDSMALSLYSTILIQFFNLTYLPITVICAASCVVQLYYIVVVKLAPTMSRIWLSWNLIVTGTLTAALALKYYW